MIWKNWQLEVNWKKKILKEGNKLRVGTNKLFFFKYQENFNGISHILRLRVTLRHRRTMRKRNLKNVCRLFVLFLLLIFGMVMDECLQCHYQWLRKKICYFLFSAERNQWDDEWQMTFCVFEVWFVFKESKEKCLRIKVFGLMDFKLFWRLMRCCGLFLDGRLEGNVGLSMAC